MGGQEKALHGRRGRLGMRAWLTEKMLEGACEEAGETEAAQEEKSAGQIRPSLGRVPE